MTHNRLRLAVTGLRGQVVSSLIERASKDVEIIALGRPQLDLALRGAVLASLRHAGCDIIVNAAAYTQVDRAESEPDIANCINGDGAQNVAEAAAQLNVPLIHLSTDYVFSGDSAQAYCEADTTAPVTAYGKSKLLGEQKISAVSDNFIILRTAWVYSPFGQNFVKTMLRLGREREEISVVCDQMGNPTSALDLADHIIRISRRLISDPSKELRGIFHLTGAGEASWAEMAEEIFSISSQKGGHVPLLKRILTKDYPTPASRPLNSRLNNLKIQQAYDMQMPNWKNSIRPCVERLLGE